jgi:hypothetical protein
VWDGWVADDGERQPGPFRRVGEEPIVGADHPIPVLLDGERLVASD